MTIRNGKARLCLAMLLPVIVAALLPGLADAHQFAPALLELREIDASRVAVRWKQPIVRVMGSRVQPVLPGDCNGIGKPEVSRKGTGMDATWQIECPGGLFGKSVGAEGITESRANVLLRVELGDGRSFRHILTGDSPVYRIPEQESRFSVFASYAELGIEHILTGYDHLVFVLGLTLLAGYSRLLLWTITAFTLGHSVTLAFAVLGFVNFPPAAIEAGIAISIYVLAIELVRSERKTVLRNYPWLVAGLFGLLHGFGFAGALAEVGLPQGEIPLALFAFNVGIELGQLGFVAVVLVFWAMLRKLPFSWPRPVQLFPAYAIGSLAAFWFLERSWSFLSMIGTSDSFQAA